MTVEEILMPMFTFATEYEKFDTVQVELPSVREAWQQAVAATGELLRDVDGHMGLPAELTMTVSDDTGTPLFQLRCSTHRLST
jgi:hypothetical protein